GPVGVPGMMSGSSYMPGTLVKIPEGMSVDQVLSDFDPDKLGITLPDNVKPEDFAKALKGEIKLDDTTKDIIKGLNGGKFGPMGNPYGVSGPAQALMTTNPSDMGETLVKMSQGAPGNPWITKAQDLEKQGKYKEAAEVLSDPNAPFAQAEGSPPLIYKSLLEAKAAGKTIDDISDIPVAPPDDMGSKLVKLSEGAADSSWISKAYELEQQGKYKEAAEVLSDPQAPFAKAEGSAPLLYKAQLEAKAAGKAVPESTNNDSGIDIIEDLPTILTDTAVTANPNPLFIEVKKLADAGDYKEAASKLKDPLSKFPDALVQAYAATLEIKAGDKSAAVSDIEKAIAIAPGNDAIFEKAGEIYQQSGITGPKVFVNGVKPEFDTKPLVEQNRTLVPFRAVAESLGASVGYDDETQTVTVMKGDNIVEMKIGSKQATVNGKPATLDVPAKTINNRTVVPLRFVSEALDAKVDYDGKTEIIKIQPE
ncbi:MAG: stalk domain-containing protein, partial [Deltaproteobacteria bacterium]